MFVATPMGIAMVDGDSTTAGATCPYTHGGGAMLLIADAAGAFDVAIGQAGGRLIRRIGWAAVGFALLGIAVWNFKESRIDGPRCKGAAVPIVFHDATRSWDR